MLRLLTAAALGVVVLSCAQAQDTSESEPVETSYLTPVQQEFIDSLTPVTGEVRLPGGRAMLQVPDTYYYLSPDDAERVLVEAWGNPPGIETLGMLFQAGQTPLDDTWGVNIYFDAIGYVSDEDAADIDFDDILRDLQAATRASNSERERLGFESVELIGWSPEPRYDGETHQVYWGKLLRFEGVDGLTLNYEAQTLGRRGVLVMNFIAGDYHLDEIIEAAPQVLDMPEYTVGNRYMDFDPSMDEVAAVGVGGLIAGGILQKTGLLAILLAFFKKGWVIIIAAGAAIWRFASAMLGRRKSDSTDQ